jgi:hypothetical protein
MLALFCACKKSHFGNGDLEKPNRITAQVCGHISHIHAIERQWVGVANGAVSINRKM